MIYQKERKVVKTDNSCNNQDMINCNLCAPVYLYTWDQSSICFCYKSICFFFPCKVPHFCSIEGKPLCYHSSDSDLIPLGGHTNRSPSLLVLLGQLSLSSFWGANTGSSPVRVAPVDHHWWYDRRVCAYVPGSVGHIQVDWSTEPHGFRVSS